MPSATSATRSPAPLLAGGPIVADGGAPSARSHTARCHIRRGRPTGSASRPTDRRSPALTPRSEPQAATPSEETTPWAEAMSSPPTRREPLAEAENCCEGRSTRAWIPAWISATERSMSTLPSTSKYPSLWKMSLPLAIEKPWTLPCSVDLDDDRAAVDERDRDRAGHADRVVGSSSGIAPIITEPKNRRLLGWMSKPPPNPSR